MPILNIFVPQVGHMPWVAGLPFFMVMALADKIIAEGKADIVSIGKAQIADPDLVNKSRRGELDEIRPCIVCHRCGSACGEALPIRCSVNPVSGREVEHKYIFPNEKKKKVVIIGGGPAGMEAAIIASSRGHQVTLCEKEPELGGSLRYAAGPSFKADTRKYLDWIVGKTKRSPIELKLSCQVTADFVKNMKPDVLILAVGASPIVPNIPGIENPNVFFAGDVCFGKAVPGKAVVVAGSGLTGCEVAVELALQGKSVTIVDIISESEIAQDAWGDRRSSLLNLIKENNVTVKTGMKLVQITDKGATVIDKDLNYHELPADAIVLSLGVEPCSDILEALQGIVDETYTIGDCLRPGNIYKAVHDGFNTAVAI